jgi:diguanylate cyclase (GGDEF)-like protein
VHAPQYNMIAAQTAVHAQHGDPYAEQRARDFRRLGFAPKLEREFRLHMRADQRTSTLVCIVTALGIWLAFIALDLSRLNTLREISAGYRDVGLAMALRLSTLAAIAALLYMLLTRRLPRAYHWLSVLVLVLIGTASAFIANMYKLRDLPQADLAQLVVIAAVFLPLGLTFYQSLAIALFIAVLTTVLGLVMLDDAHMLEHVRLSVLLFFAVFVSAVGAYLREYAQRDQFLLRRILHNHAMSDALTGIDNRRSFEQHAAVTLLQGRRDRIGVAFAVLDIDHFKKYNDRYGHQAGDHALGQVASAIASCLRRPMDMVGRIGGEEFAIVLYGADPEQARRMLSAVIDTVAALAIRHEASDTADCLSVSIGAACFDGSETLEQLYRRADLMLYESKRNGRNRLTLC